MMYHLAQINIAKLLEPIDSPLLEDFVEDLDRINEIAEKSEGFVWRLKDDTGNATNINPFDDSSFIVNMSVWETVDDLKDFVYNSDHMEVFRKRAKWFERMKTPHMALWWVKVGDYPTAEDGKNKLLELEKYGETESSFSFKELFDTSITKNK
nr:DUF3291 domain-containing protein [uncultured Flavobacterium sp.]